MDEPAALGTLGLFRRRFPDRRFAPTIRVGVASIQHESNSFAPGVTHLESFRRIDGDDLDGLAGTNTEMAGALAELTARGAVPVPLVHAHALPSAPLSAETGRQLVEWLDRSVRSQGPLDALVLALHGAATTVDDVAFDRTLVSVAREAVGPHAVVALTLDLHANVTPELLTGVDAVVGYLTNPHVDQQRVGRRAVELLAAIMGGAVRPVIAVSTCPALFPDQTLRLPGGVLDRVISETLDELATTTPRSVLDAVVEIGIFPTQPWLDAPGAGFTVAVTSDGDRTAARVVAEALVRAVWERRHEFVVAELVPPGEAVRRARNVVHRPAVIAESADAPTAGAAGDGTGMLSVLIREGFSGRVLLTIVDPDAVEACHAVTPGTQVPLSLGAHVDARWSEPVELTGTVVRVGGGTHSLRGVGYEGMSVSMGRFAVVSVALLDAGVLDVLVTETPAWSADPGSWQHAGLDPMACDLLVVRSCTDYLANFPHAVAETLIADVPGAASIRLERLTYERITPPPHPVRDWTEPAATNAIFTDDA
ncbi:MAG TPA: M81 family metallopeptidase [Ilumatobacteraceae bacterium]|nr:M81 family metallopeptidase [Ilumatobacteraceae bacterium]